LQHIMDAKLVTLDSLVIEGDGKFAFSTVVESPEIFYLYLKKADNNDYNDRITFFGEAGEITINTSWNTFDANATISGSASHEIYMECQNMLNNFNKKDLELVQAASKLDQSDSLALDSVQKLMDNNYLRRYQYVLNFALNNTDSPVGPYVAISEASDANRKYLDSINNSLSPEVANSKYGKRLDVFLKNNGEEQ